MIFGLSFATFLTLILVPVMYLMASNTKGGLKKLFRKLSPAPVPSEAAVKQV